MLAARAQSFLRHSTAAVWAVLILRRLPSGDPAVFRTAALLLVLLLLVLPHAVVVHLLLGMTREVLRPLLNELLAGLAPTGREGVNRFACKQGTKQQQCTVYQGQSRTVAS